MRPRCCYLGCKAEAVGEMPRGQREPWPLCEIHSQQRMHPVDIDVKRFVPYPESSSR